MPKCEPHIERCIRYYTQFIDTAPNDIKEPSSKYSVFITHLASGLILCSSLFLTSHLMPYSSESPATSATPALVKRPSPRPSPLSCKCLPSPCPILERGSHYVNQVQPAGLIIAKQSRSEKQLDLKLPFYLNCKQQ